jgi:hypothetical protein
LENRPND